jgi:hypothetical protein
MKTATIVINQNSHFAQTQLVLKDDYGFRHAKEMIKHKGFGNYSKARFFFELPIRNIDGEELVAYVSCRMCARWSDIQSLAEHLQTLSTTWMLGESSGYALIGGYMCTTLSDEWYEDITNHPNFNQLEWSEGEPQAQFRGNIHVRPKFSLPVSVNPEGNITTRKTAAEKSARLKGSDSNCLD